MFHYFDRRGDDWEFRESVDEDPWIGFYGMGGGMELVVYSEGYHIPWRHITPNPWKICRLPDYLLTDKLKAWQLAIGG